MRPFKTIMLTGEMKFPHRPDDSWESAFGRYCNELSRIGFTHVQINFLADPYHEILLEQPGNHYAWFANYGPSLDQFVSSDLNKGTYLEAHLAKNRKRLISAAKIAISCGLKPMLMLCEPRFVPERFFRKYPHLRGPRVDNPAFSTTPWYSLCTDMPEVRQHYEQMLLRLMEYVPELAGISVFTNDSGAGFCHSKNLYCGPNGPRHCRERNVGKRIADFLGLLQKTGAKVNREFRVSLATGIDGQERFDFIRYAPKGVTSETQGKYSWLGGLEAQWAYHQYGRKIERVGYEQARKERIDEFVEKLDAVKNAQRLPIAICSMPTEGYSPPICYVPHPFEDIEILNIYRRLGVEHLNCKGYCTTSDIVRLDVNREAFGRYMKSEEKSADEIIREIAIEYAGEKYADVLFEAWRIVNDVFRHRPLWDHFFGYRGAMLPGSLVPCPDELPKADIKYYYHHAWDDLKAISDSHPLDTLKMDEQERSWLIKIYTKNTIPQLQKAIDMLEQAYETVKDDAAFEILSEQAEYIYHFLLWQKSAYNWCEAGAYLAPGDGTPKPKRAIMQIIDDEIEVTKQFIVLLEGRAYKFIHLAEMEGMLYEKWPNFVEQLKCRVDVMNKHRSDTIVPIGIGASGG